jgi:hypothetical protein
VARDGAGSNSRTSSFKEPLNFLIQHFPTLLVAKLFSPYKTLHGIQLFKNIVVDVEAEA